MGMAKASQKPNKIKRLTVSWQRQADSLPVHEWFKIPGNLDIGRFAATEQYELSMPGWDRRVFDILDWAFGAGLTRFMGWDLSARASDRELWQKAASLYKRGVGTTPPSGVESSQGKYSIDIIEANVAKGFDPDAFYVVDKNVFSLWQNQLPFGDSLALVDCREESKTIASVNAILKKWEKSRKPQKWILVGGGLLLDVANFAASLAECTTHLYPTTLLSMVDASIGGKCGVNYKAFGKNQVGCFHFPESVVVSSQWLTTLPEEEWFSGGAECLKHAIIAGNEKLLIKVSKILSEKDPRQLQTIIEPLIKIKRDIVSKDPFEESVRAYLNFGHTLGHALEALAQRNQTKKRISHGRAVAVGMEYACKLAKAEGMISEDIFNTYMSAIRDSGVLLDREALNKQIGCDFSSKQTMRELAELMKGDKKNIKSDRLTWILPFHKSNEKSEYGVTVCELSVKV